MNNIVLNCSSTTELYLQQFLKTNNIFPTTLISENTILIKEISTLDDINTLKALIKNISNIYIICIIAKNELIFDIMDCIHPLNIWRKDFIEDDCLNLLSLLNIQQNNTHKIMLYQSSNNCIQVSSSNIIYIESFGHYLTFHTLSTSFRVRKKISEALVELQDFGFIRIHKSFIVNKKFIYSASTKEYILTNNKVLPAGNKYKHSL